MLLSVLSRTQLFVVLIIGGLATALGETAANPNSPKLHPKRLASTSQTQVTTIC